MWKKFKKWVASLFSKQFIHPVVNERVDHVITDKIKAQNKAAAKEMEQYTQIMADYLKTYFSRKYLSDMDAQLAFDTIDKEWKILCRKVNSTSRTINLKKDEFRIQVEKVLEKEKNKQQQKQAQ